MSILDAVRPLKTAPKRAKAKGGRTPEGKVKAQVKEVLNVLGCYWFMPVTGGYSCSGVPDFVACVGGRFVGIETKSVHSSHGVTRLQELNSQNIRKNSGIALVITEDNINTLQSLLEQLCQKQLTASI